MYEYFLFFIYFCNSQGQKRPFRSLTGIAPIEGFLLFSGVFAAGRAANSILVLMDLNGYYIIKVCFDTDL